MYVKILDDFEYANQHSFSMKIVSPHSDKSIGFARAEKSDGGFKFPLLRLMKGTELQHLKNAKAILISRLSGKEVAEFVLDNLSLNAQSGFLQMTGRLF